MSKRLVTLIALASVASAFSLPYARAASPPRAASLQLVKDVAQQAGVAETTRTFSVNVSDFNKDGKDDPMIVRHGPQQCCPDPRLYRNRGDGTFTNLNQNWGGKDKHDCTWADFNQDGLPDTFCAVGFGQFSVNELWKQQADGSFVNVAQAQGLTRPTHGRYRSATFIDANNDPWPDIYVTRYTGSSFQVDPYPGDDFTNELWINEGNGNGFHLAPSWGLNVKDGAHKDADSCNEAKDFNGDGLEDLIVCSPFGFRLYKNTGSSFVNVAQAKNVGGKFFDAEWADFNKDGLLDLVQVKEKLVRVMLQTPSGTFAQSYNRTLVAGQNIGVGDINGDGFADVWVVGSCPRGKITDQPDYLLMNSGTGTFISHQEPALGTNGCGDAVTSHFDYNQDGKTDFLVINGRKHRAGPVQLFTWAP